MRLRLIVTCLSVLHLVASPLRAQRVRITNGDVLYEANGSTRRLAVTGRAREAVLAPDGRQVVFILETSHNVPGTGSGRAHATELWIVQARGGEPRLLLAGREAPSAESTLANFNSLQFAPDSRTVYLLSDAWATSAAVHAVSVATGAERYLCPGNTLRVQRDGQLVVSQHRNYPNGGSYNQEWLISPSGAPVKPLSAPEP